ncbi:MAG TPA: ATP-binding protein [Phycisphaerae bacterium]|nr:ATP-binding protein [Phycisphaerae bacterium]HNU44638.1 ATP-binding protein [Phycisphaerae bacterium]
MGDAGRDVPARPSERSGRPAHSAGLSGAVLHCASRGLSRTDFLHETSKLLMRWLDCDAVEIRLGETGLPYRWVAARRPEPGARLELAHWVRAPEGILIPVTTEPADLERLCRDVATRRFDATQPFFTAGGSFWTADAWERTALAETPGTAAEPKSLCVGGHYRSLAVCRFVVDEGTIGLAHFKSESPHRFTREDVELFEEVAQTVGLALADWRAQCALRERVKELTCLYGIAQAAEQAGESLAETIQRIVCLLPPAWQYPEIAAARIVLDGAAYASADFRQSVYRQTAEIVVGGRRRGAVEVAYLEGRPEFAAGAFLPEEKKLLTAVAREVALIVDRREAAQERSALQLQLIHADRLATIGQLSAGVAHELNEPLGAILGFAQLARKCPGLPESAAQDLEKIITGSLYAREVIKKLMVFGRRMPARKAQVKLNQVVEEALYFLEARCAKGGTQVVRDLAPDVPEINADAAQLKQVLVNLVVNALQAMPSGGTLTVATRGEGSTVALIVQDTGTGMTEDVMGKIFLPFFTTKEAGEGTGLGLPVVHGIVSLHGGSIDVQSRPGQGARFEVRLPTSGSPAVQEATQDGERG